MGKFEKGQYVRCVGANDTELLTVGKVYKVDAVDGGYIDVELDNGSVGGMWSHRFEVWQPKVGERVQVTYGHGLDGEAVVDRVSGAHIIATMKTGKYVGIEGGFTVACLQPFVATVSATATLTIEAGKFYKTRDGRKVGPAKLTEWPNGDWKWSLGQLWLFKDDGTSGGTDRENDIIAEWVDEPVAPVASGSKASNDNAEPAKPKFKVGDRVIGESGAIYTIVDNSDNEHWPLRSEGEFGASQFWRHDGTAWSLHKSGGDNLVKAVPIVPTIVALIENGTAKPATRPKVHADQASATTEAERLALAYPGQQFGVFVLADSKIADLVNVPTAVLRAA